MEIGQKTIEKKNKTKTFSIINLSIHIGYNEITFIVFDEIDSQILNCYTSDYSTNNDINLIISGFFSKNKTYTFFNTIELIHFNNLHTIVPKALFNKKDIKEYLKFNTTSLKTDKHLHEYIENNESVNVFIPVYFNINQLSQFTKEVKQSHYTTILLTEIFKIEKNNTSSNVYLNINKSKIDLILISENKLKFINTFDFTCEEDILYYVLFCYEQLNLNPENIPVIISGRFNESTYNIIYKYIRNVSTYDSKIEMKDYPVFNNNLITPI